ncbi:MAG TPA: alpha-1,4-glucan--maltose-1-phosphate maltosyltransferase [Chthoniobacteraceae bacterium]|jgi:starch synthase (maltosyl-transferring)
MHRHPPTAVIENVTPLVDGGRRPVKRAAGEDLIIEADIFKDGHDIVSAVLKWREKGQTRWSETPMQPIPNGNDRWRGTCSLYVNATYEYTIEAWGDVFFSWQHEFATKFGAGQEDLKSETLEGALFIEKSAKIAAERKQKPDSERLLKIAAQIRKAQPAEVNEIAHYNELEALMTAYADRSESTEFVLAAPDIECLVAAAANATPEDAPAKTSKGSRGKKTKVDGPPEPVVFGQYPLIAVDRERALFAQWYEFFPRSAEGRGDRGSTFRDCLPRIDDAKAMGFDVIYFPPIHPIGITARKGRNNAVKCEPGEPGVPYAIGNRHQNCPNGGGHKDVAPELGTLEDFDWLIGQLHERGMELALDFAINCSPDHPYVHDHPEWFYQRPDGTIKYAENPPKKYQDVYPLNFHNPDWPALWDELTSVILFWAEHGVRVFRVDNPHTKPVSFWEYLITKVHAQFPDVIFLSEAFTRPKMMKALAKAGFTQSYTYFTWRTTKSELTDYFTELTQTDMVEYYRANLWPNTPDILPFFLQHGGRPAFLIRAVLATTLSPIYGIYSGFELCENAALPNREEYLDSEKYQWKERDWNAPGNIKDYITRLNRIRRENRALQQYRNLRFHGADNDQVLFYSRATAARDNIILVAVSLDPWNARETYLNIPVEEFGWLERDTYQVHDLLDGARYLWTGSRNYVKLDPGRPAHVFRVRRWTSREQDFDYFL